MVHLYYQGPKDHTNIKILQSGSKAQDKADSRNHVLWKPYVHGPRTIYHIPCTIYYMVPNINSRGTQAHLKERTPQIYRNSHTVPMIISTLNLQYINPKRTPNPF